ncbi:MAG TPA: efflux RND transporter periplasmic adaptor subunit [Chitinophagaceae bacterium]|nr:efflux RND transporter periplasmic adaptor subunit [Chitinophagaceae bacterium]
MITPNSKLYILISAAVCAIFISAGCGHNSETQSDTKQAFILTDSIAKRLEIDSVLNSSVVKSINLTGKVGFNEDRVARIFPLVSGIAQNVNVMLGDYVQAGQVLATLRSSEMAGYSTDLITAETNVKVAKESLDAAADMYKSGLLSSKDYLAAQSNYQQANAFLIKAQRILNLNGGSTNGSMVVKSPISGFVVEKNLISSMAIRPDNTSNLFTISDLKDVWVTANVYESNISFVQTGDSVTVTTISYPEKIFHGKVDKIMNVLDPTNKVMKVRIVLPNPGYLLKPEMFANVTIFSKKETGEKMLSIPSNALIFDNSQYYVLVYKSNSDITIRPVIVGSTTGERTYIQSGLKQGERVITSNALLIYQQLNS